MMFLKKGANMHVLCIMLLTSFSYLFCAESLNLKIEELKIEKQKGIQLQFDVTCFDNQDVLKGYQSEINTYASLCEQIGNKPGIIGLIYRAERGRLAKDKTIPKQQQEIVTQLFKQATNKIELEKKEVADKDALIRQYYWAYKCILEDKNVVYPKDVKQGNTDEWNEAFLEANINMDIELGNWVLAGSFLLYATKTFEVIKE